jgi:hypothetical protein
VLVERCVKELPHASLVFCSQAAKNLLLE